jgi:hypothetical protein
MLDPNDVEKRISVWLNEQGYPLEMRVASILQQQGFRVVQSDYFIDPETGDYRELDVVAFQQKMIENVLFRMSLLVECKRSTDKPWLLFTSERTRLADPARVAQRAATALGRRYLCEICHELEVQALPLFALPDRPAYGITQAFTTGKDICYSAVTSVSKAALARVSEYDPKKIARVPGFRIRRETDFCSIVFPIVVVEGGMFEVYLDGRTQVVVHELESSTLLWRNPLVGMPHTIVDVVPFSSFSSLSSAALTSINRMFELSEGNLLQSYRKAIAGQE